MRCMSRGGDGASPPYFGLPLGSPRAKYPRMRRFEFAGVIAFAFLTGCGQAPEKTAMQKIEGNWTCASAVVDGKALPEATVQLLRLTLTRDRYTTRKDSEVLFDSTYTTDVTKHPKQINMVGTEGALQGKEAHGIYRLDGDTLTICYTMPGKERPTTFESQAGSGAYLIFWKR